MLNAAIVRFKLSFVSLAFVSFVVGITLVALAADIMLTPILAIAYAGPAFILRMLASQQFWKIVLPREHSVVASRLDFDVDELTVAYATGFLPGALVSLSVEALIGSAITVVFYLDQQFFAAASQFGPGAAVATTTTTTTASEADSFAEIDGSGAGVLSSKPWFSASLRKTIAYCAFLFVTSFITTGLIEEAVRWTFSIRLCRFQQRLAEETSPRKIVMPRQLRKAPPQADSLDVAFVVKSDTKQLGVTDIDTDSQNNSTSSKRNFIFGAPESKPGDVIPKRKRKEDEELIPTRKRKEDPAPSNDSSESKTGVDVGEDTSDAQSLQTITGFVLFVAAYSIGFSTIENILYAVTRRIQANSHDTTLVQIGAAISRCAFVTTVHCACGVVSGVNIGLNMARLSKNRDGQHPSQPMATENSDHAGSSGGAEDEVKVHQPPSSQRVSSQPRVYMSFQAILPSVLLHGFYNFASSLIKSMTSKSDSGSKIMGQFGFVLFVCEYHFGECTPMSFYHLIRKLVNAFCSYATCAAACVIFCIAYTKRKLRLHCDRPMLIPLVAPPPTT